MPCPFCKTPSDAKPLKVPAKREGVVRDWIWCAGCELYYIRNYREAAYADWPAESYQFGNPGIPAGFEYHLGLVHRHLLPPGKLLDVGAGPGYAVDNARANGWQAEGVEPWKALVEWGRKYLDLDMSTTQPDRPEYYDVILCTEVAEHIADCREFVNSLYRLQAPGGLLFITVPNGTCWPARENPQEWGPIRNELHCLMFSMAGLHKVLTDTGWIVAESFEACGPHDDEQLHVIARKPGSPRVREVPRSWLERLGASSDPRKAVKIHEYLSDGPQAVVQPAGTARLDSLEARIETISRRLDSNTIEAETLSLKDAYGRVRVVLGIGDDGAVGMHLLDGNGAVRGRIATQEDDSPVMALLDAESTVRLGIMVDGASPLMVMTDDNGTLWPIEPAPPPADK